ncbi:polysaccharide deacetylase family protein [Paenibacillus pasadenensis]|uniref:Peptidoglycan N-acetylglucosamine deacetylase n=1 Tax=Paenibacillus pasadenensis TaxID=217090 RepID=A0A2N5N2M5_9BACL|nr:MULTISPECIES: polysaccharide deacetylase family protein [Paenibacillus]ASO66295.1 chitin deacetylase [Paenibacillus pasadenensis]PLT44584.1 Peptidoglycan N-acetylglucosamine deacetylase [Paenibacillus pasadenensis]QGG55077.1 polysaccharide deacetylase family protein [Paenibacillus sp. B01]
MDREAARIIESLGEGAEGIALTFDDGPDPEFTPRVLELLARYGAKATFFLLGMRAAEQPELAARIAAEGHEIGNHTWLHPDLTAEPEETARREIGQAQQLLERLSGRAPVLFRSPYGTYDDRLLELAGELGFGFCLWSVDTEDWRLPGADALTERLSRARPGDVVLMHDAGGDRSQTVEALERALPELAARFRLDTVSSLLRRPGG